MTVTESALLAELRNGNQQAFRRLLESHQDKVYNTCLGFVRDPEDASDLTQEVFIQVYRSVSRFEGKSSLSTWIYRIAVNKALEHLRKKKKRSLVSWLPFSGDQDSPERQLPDPVHPGLLLENQERSEQLFAAIDKLPERQKSALVLYQFEELSYKEICDVLELSLSSVESLIFRAKKNLKKHLQAYFEKRGS
ncbi:MAG: sigma-70 family RNA polymerase sigma factor [Bacteroidota bacterium]